MNKSPSDFVRNAEVTFHGPATRMTSHGQTNRRSLMEVARRAVMAGMVVGMSVGIAAPGAHAEVVQRIPDNVVARLLSSPSDAAMAGVDEAILRNLLPMSPVLLREPEEVVAREISNDTVRLRLPDEIRARAVIPQTDQHMCPPTPEEVCTIKP